MKQLTASKENIEPLLKWLIDNNLWLVRESGVEAFLSTCHILDKGPTKDLHATPYDPCTERKPNIITFRLLDRHTPRGCLAKIR